jgi:hypothetical protein
MEKIKRVLRASGIFTLLVVAILCAAFWVGHNVTGAAAAQPQQAGQTSGANTGGVYWKIDAERGPVDLALTDPALIGAIDIHAHLDPDAPGFGGQVRALDAFEAAALAKARGMRGLVIKTHQDHGSAGEAYMVRRHWVPGFEAFGRMGSNMATGGINVAALEHFAQIKGGWGRIYEMPTRDSCGAGPVNMDPKFLAANRPWMLLMPPGSSNCIPVAKNGELLPEMKHLISVMANIRTVDSNGKMVLATGHATNEEHLLIAREGRKQGLQVVLTHPASQAGFYIPQMPEIFSLGAYTEMDASYIYKTEAGMVAAAAFVKKIGAEHIVVGTDCGQTVNLYPTDCLALAAKGMRAHGVTERELDLMYKVNPAKLLGLPPLDETMIKQQAIPVTPR